MSGYALVVGVGVVVVLLVAVGIGAVAWSCNRRKHTTRRRKAKRSLPCAPPILACEPPSKAATVASYAHMFTYPLYGPPGFGSSISGSSGLPMSSFIMETAAVGIWDIPQLTKFTFVHGTVGPSQVMFTIEGVRAPSTGGPLITFTDLVPPQYLPFSNLRFALGLSNQGVLIDGQMEIQTNGTIYIQGPGPFLGGEADGFYTITVPLSILF